MDVIAFGAARYVVTASARGERWTAYAVHAESGERFGIECAGDTEAEAIDGLTTWLTWQSEHAAALAALQQAERIYYRTLAGGAFAGSELGSSAVDARQESLDQMEAARVRLDEVRARRPN